MDEHRTWSPEELARINQLYALRAHLEGFAARRAAVRVAQGTSPGVLEECHRQMMAAAQRGDHAAFFSADMAFHREIVELAHTPTLPGMWELLSREGRGFVEWAYQHIFHDLRAVALSHRPILEAVCAGHPQEAARAASASLDALWQMLADPTLLPTGGGGPVERVCIYILLNLHERLPIADLAANVAHLSRTHLVRRFRQECGESIGRYVRRVRLARAATLLKETELSVQQIADRVGYSDPSHFAEHFRREFGRVPSHSRGMGRLA